MSEFNSEDFFDINRPLAYCMRPRTLNDFFGQEHLLAEDKILYKIIKNQKLVNMIFFGPSGSGKTALVKIISREMNIPIFEINATSSGVADIKKIIQEAKSFNENYKKQILVMIDEIHHFNKTQQDSLLPSIESGSIILIGITTENPYFYINNAIISRSLVFEFKKLKKEDILNILKKAVNFLYNNYKNDFEKNNNENKNFCEDEVLEYISEFANGDARYVLNVLEATVSALYPEITLENFKKSFNDIFKTKISYDKKQNFHYDVISAFIKSMRGSDPDATLYWLALMLEAGEDISFIARRIAICASEDVGLAHPNILSSINAGWEMVEKIGMPEARIILAEMAVLVAISPKSNSAYVGINNAIEDVKNGKILEVPIYLKTVASKNILKDAEVYKYPHDYKQHFVSQKYLDNYFSEKYYKPGNEGQEKIYKEFLYKLWNIKK